MADANRPSLHIRELVIRGGDKKSAAMTAHAFETALQSHVSSIQGASRLGTQTLRVRGETPGGAGAGTGAAHALARQLSGGGHD